MRVPQKAAKYGYESGFQKNLPLLFNPSKKDIHFVEIARLNFLMLDGRGVPNTTLEYQPAVEALYALSYGIKFALKSQGFDHIIPPLEG